MGQTLTSEEGQRSGSYALGNVHREVELDLYENYAGYVIDVINNQFIPSIIELNWGESTELPFLEVELDRPSKDFQRAERDKLLFAEMGLPVAKQWLYDRHKVPAPGPSEDLFIQHSPALQNTTAPTRSHSCDCVTQGKSESTESLRERQATAAENFAALLAKTDLSTHDLIWAGGDCPICAPFNGTAYGVGWTEPPPLHYNCDCEVVVQTKDNQS